MVIQAIIKNNYRIFYICTSDPSLIFKSIPNNTPTEIVTLSGSSTTKLPRIILLLVLQLLQLLQLLQTLIILHNNNTLKHLQ